MIRFDCKLNFLFLSYIRYLNLNAFFFVVQGSIITNRLEPAGRFVIQVSWGLWGWLQTYMSPKSPMLKFWRKEAIHFRELGGQDRPLLLPWSSPSPWFDSLVLTGWEAWLIVKNKVSILIDKKIVSFLIDVNEKSISHLWTGVRSLFKRKTCQSKNFI